MIIFTIVLCWFLYSVISLYLSYRRHKAFDELFKPTNLPETIKSIRTMDDVYGDGSDHIYCEVCGECKTCGCACDENSVVMSAQDVKLAETLRKLTFTGTTNIPLTTYSGSTYPVWRKRNRK